MNRIGLHVFFIVGLLPGVSWSADPQWGDLRGRFVYDGEPPPVKVLQINKDRAELGNPIEDESLMVNDRNGGIANVVVYLLTNNRETLDEHASYADTAEATVELASKDGRIVPHVLLVRTSQAIFTCNKDKIGHNLSIGFLGSSVPGTLLPAGDDVRRYTKEQPFPVPVVCNIHPWMRGYVLLRSNPYMAKTDVDGRFQIRHLPVGEHVIQIWHERAGFVRDVHIGPHSTDSKGRLRVAIRPGNNELADTRLPTKLFAVGK